MRAKTVAIIGAGPAGLTATKAVLEEGLKPAVFERQAGIGGLWNRDSGAMWDSMRTNLSRHSCMYSDFPWPEGTVDFPGHEAMQDYLERYADHFKLRQYIRTQNAVTDIAQSGSGWTVSAANENGAPYTETFDALIDASGFFSHPDRPSGDGLPMRSLHSHDYRRPSDFSGKNVIVVGNSFSGTEIAAEVATAAAGVTHMLRRPGWIGSRYIAKAPGAPLQPLDLLFYRRADNARQGASDPVERQRLGRAFMREACGDPGAIDPALAIDLPDGEAVYLSIAETYAAQVRRGAIKIERAAFGPVNPWHGDAVIFATGYRLALPFRNAALRQTLSYQPDDKFQPLILHEGTFHPDAPNLAFVGLYKGPYFATMELQARWAAATFSGRLAPPARPVAEAGLDAERAIRAQTPRPQFPRSYIDFSDRIAAAIGVMPEIVPGDALSEKIWTGPFSPAHYRLNGPGATPALARAIIHALPP